MSNKNEYFKQLRERWAQSKKLAESDQQAKAIYQEVLTSTNSQKFSYWSFYFTLMDMKKAGFDGLPYIDCKTYKGWKDSGFIVNKGEHSKIDGIVWMHPKFKDDDGEESEDENTVYPKLYHLFHKSQVQAL